MTDAPYPFLSEDTLKLRLENVDEYRLELGLTATEVSQLFTDIIEEETAFVARILDGQGVVLSDYPTRDDLLAEYPVVRRAMVRLCRSSLAEIQEQGLEKEKIGDHSESYTAPGTIRALVEEELAKIDVPMDENQDGIPDTRISLI